MTTYDMCGICHELSRGHDPDTFVSYKEYEPGGPLNRHEVEVLVKCYGPQEIPPCRVCGAELTIGSMGGGEATTWHCSSDEATWLKPGVKDSWNGPEITHYRESEWKQYNHENSVIMRLLEHGVES